MAPLPGIRGNLNYIGIDPKDIIKDTDNLIKEMKIKYAAIGAVNPEDVTGKNIAEVCFT